MFSTGSKKFSYLGLYKIIRTVERIISFLISMILI